jgi:hypothetical protein
MSSKLWYRITVSNQIMLIYCCFRWRYPEECYFEKQVEYIKQTNSVAFSPQANYTDWSTATGRWILMPTFVVRGVLRGQGGGTPTAVNLSFLDRSRYLRWIHMWNKNVFRIFGPVIPWNWKISWRLVRKLSIPTERAPPSTNFSAKFCWYRGIALSVRRFPHGRKFLFSRPETLLFLSGSSSFVLMRLSGPRSRPTATQKSGSAENGNLYLWICSQKLWPLNHTGGLVTPWEEIICAVRTSMGKG